MFCELRVPKPAQAPKTTKKNKVKVEETNKKKKKQELWAHFRVVAGNIVFLFFWCLSMFGASSGFFFVFFLVPANVLHMSPQDHDEKKLRLLGF